MNRVKGPARLGFAAALLALLLGPLAFGTQSAHAQGPNVAQYWGTGLSDGDTVGAWIDGTQCSETTANAAGEWALQVGPDGDCSPEDGDTVNFSLNGEVAEQTESWAGGGTPSDPAGISLTVAEGMGEGMGENGEGMGENGEGMGENGEGMTAPQPGEPGQAGLVTGAAGSSLLALALGILAVAGIAGARLATRRVS